MIDPRLLDDPRLTFALPPAVIGHLRSADGVKARASLLEEYRKASPAPGFEPLLTAAIERTRATFKLMLQDRVSLIFGSDTPGGRWLRQSAGAERRLELQNWADADAPLSLIPRAATLDNATALGVSRELGSIEVGKRADLLLLKENPLANVRLMTRYKQAFSMASQSREKHCAHTISEEQPTIHLTRNPTIAPELRATRKLTKDNSVGART